MKGRGVGTGEVLIVSASLGQSTAEKPVRLLRLTLRLRRLRGGNEWTPIGESFPIFGKFSNTSCEIIRNLLA